MTDERMKHINARLTEIRSKGYQIKVNGNHVNIYDEYDGAAWDGETETADTMIDEILSTEKSRHKQHDKLNKKKRGPKFI